MQTLYTAQAAVAGLGRSGGHGRTSEGGLEVKFDSPKALGGAGGPGTNPEELVALGYAACFRSALGRVAAHEKIAVKNATVTCRAAIGRNEHGEYELEFVIEAEFPDLSQAEADLLVAEAHQVCPYSRAFKHGAKVEVLAKAQA